MATAARPTKSTAPVDETPDVSTVPEGWEWETVSEGAATKIIFDTIGDEFVGEFIGKDHIDREPAADGSDQSFDMWQFRGQDKELYAINSSYELDDVLKNLNPGAWVHIKYVKNVKTNQPQPMKSFLVRIKK
jgi:hypothetical protein